MLCQILMFLAFSLAKAGFHTHRCAPDLSFSNGSMLTSFELDQTSYRLQKVTINEDESVKVSLICRATINKSIYHTIDIYYGSDKNLNVSSNSTEFPMPPGQCISRLVDKEKHPYDDPNWSAVSELMTNNKTECAVDSILFIWEDSPCYYEPEENVTTNVCSWAFVIGLALLTMVLFVAVCATLILLASACNIPKARWTCDKRKNYGYTGQLQYAVETVERNPYYEK